MASGGDKYFGSVCWFLGLLGWHAGDLIYLLVSQFLPRKGFGSWVQAEGRRDVTMQGTRLVAPAQLGPSTETQ